MRSKFLIGLAGLILGAALTLALLSFGRGPALAPLQIFPGPTELALERPLPPGLRLDGVPFEQAITMLREATGADIEVNLEALRLAGLDVNSPVRLDRTGLTLGDVLTRACAALTFDARRRAAGEEPAPPEADYTLIHDTVWVSTLHEVSLMTVTRLYDIRDLVGPIPWEVADDEDDNPPAGQDADDEEEESGPTREECVESVIFLLTDLVAEDYWIDNGGPVGWIRELDGRLIIDQSWRNHREVAAVLEGLRKFRDSPVRGPVYVDEPVSVLQWDPERGVYGPPPPPGEGESSEPVQRIYDVRDILRNAAAWRSRIATASYRFDAPHELVSSVTQIDRASWIDHGGGVGSVRLLGGLMLVEQTPANHRRIEALLDALRRGRRPPAAAAATAPSQFPAAR